MQIAKCVGSEVPFYQEHGALSCSATQSIPQTLFFLGRWHIGLEFRTDHQGSDMKLFPSGKDWKAAGAFGWMACIGMRMLWMLGS